MALGKKTGGRAAGALNKHKAELREKAAALGVDPFEILLLFAKGDWEALGYDEEFIERHGKDFTNYEYVIDPAVRAKCATEATQYLEPKRKAIELSGPNGGPIELREALTDEELDAEIKAMLTRGSTK